MQIAQHYSAEEILSKAESLGQSPQDVGKVDMLVIRPANGERQVVDHIEIDLVEGVVGDNWRTRGSSAMPDGSANPEAQVTITNSRILAAICPDQDDWPLAGDQLVVDFDFGPANLQVGERLQVGTAILELSATPHTGCAKFTERYGKAAIRFVNSAEGRELRRRGINLKVVQAGTVAVGDTVRKIAP